MHLDPNAMIAATPDLINLAMVRKLRRLPRKPHMPDSNGNANEASWIFHKLAPHR